MTYCAECGVELTEEKVVCQTCGTFILTKEMITRKIIGSSEGIILLLSIFIILLGIFSLIYINTSVPPKYRVPLLGFSGFTVILGLFFIVIRKRALEWKKQKILISFFAPIPGLPLSEKKVHCSSCGTENPSSRQICKKCEEILLTEEILVKRMTYNSKKSIFVTGIVSIICGTFFFILCYIQHDLNLFSFFWLLVCFYLIISGFFYVVIPQKLSDRSARRFLNRIKKKSSPS